MRQVVDAHAAHGTRYGPLELGASWNTLGKIVRQQSEKQVLRGAPAMLQPLAEHTEQALPKFGARPLANTVNGLAHLYAAGGWRASDALWEGLATHWEMWSFAEGGMSPMQMLSTATINPAKYLGMDKDLGSIEIGKLADLQVVDGNPLEDVKATDQITHVMVNGRLYRAGDLAEEVTGDAPAPKLWWHGQPQHEIR